VNTPLVACQVGCGLLVFWGLAHSLGHVKDKRESKDGEHVRVLRQSPANLPGVARSYLDLYDGYSWTMSLMTAAFGALLLALALSEPAVAASSRPVQAVALVASLGLAALSKRYFFLPPLLVALLAAVAFGVALATAPG
jgi:hypothetical protein